jgi:tetratricopeptide (TPR) repeat protein
MRIVTLVALLSIASVNAQSQSLEQAQRLYDAQKYPEARAMLEPLGKRDAPTALLMGKVLLQMNDASRSADWLEAAVKLDPRSSQAWDWLGRAYGTQAETANKLKQAFLAKKTKSAWERAIALDPNNLDARQDIIQYYLKAPGFMGGSKDKARQEALEIKKRNGYRGAFAAASVCAELKDQACVENEFRSLMTSYADSSAGYTQLTAFYTNNKLYDKAWAVIDARLKAKPDDAAALYSYGRTASISGQNLERGAEALKAYIAAPLPGGPGVANSHYRLGLIAEKRGQKDVARREYLEALKISPGYTEAKKALAAIGG